MRKNNPLGVSSISPFSKVSVLTPPSSLCMVTLNSLIGSLVTIEEEALMGTGGPFAAGILVCRGKTGACACGPGKGCAGKGTWLCGGGGPRI